jgi:hypothetical protein
VRRGKKKGKKMKTLVKWFVKKYITNATVKETVHKMNANFAAKVKVEGKEKVISVANDASACIAARLEGFADDGKIDETELAAINAADDVVIDKYLSDEQISAFLDRLFA